jgi:aspartyl/asparaginyl-tRNA synthetase
MTRTRICGTVRGVRKHKHSVFVDIDDGKRVLSVVIPRETLDSSHGSLHCGSSVTLNGHEFDTAGQLICSNLLIDNECDSRVTLMQNV